MMEFLGYHSECNLGSPGGWDYQRITITAGLKMDRNGRFESGRAETSTHLSIIHPIKGRHGV
ncbi:MAG: hypothetical protein LWX01_12560, partial [Deltaproteobacteria bacterium]|nr:hypothetical protein [Deltaproteobacteria bacterium]